MELVNITPFFVSAAVCISFSSADQRYMFNMFVSRYQELGVVAEMYITTFQLTRSPYRSRSSSSSSTSA